MFARSIFMSKRPLTEKQQSVYNFIVKQMAGGFPPTVREICNNSGIKSTSTVHGILGVLEEEGYIVRDAKYSRAIKLDMGYDSSMVPLVGKITAGKPILAVEEIEDYIPYRKNRYLKSNKSGNDSGDDGGDDGGDEGNDDNGYVTSDDGSYYTPIDF